MFWPSLEELPQLAWREESAWSNGPLVSELIVALRPAMRALFLQGWKTEVINFAVAGGSFGGWSGRSLEMEALELFDTNRAPSPSQGMIITFEVSPLGDRFGGAPIAYAMRSAETQIVVGEKIEEGDSLPRPVLAAIDSFVEAAIVRLMATIRDPLSRSSGEGMLWLFDPKHFAGISPSSTLPAAVVIDELHAKGDVILREQIKDARERRTVFATGLDRPPNLQWIVDWRPWFGSFLLFAGLRTELERRGEGHLLPMTAQARLETDGGPSWLDTILELARRGVIILSDLIEVEEPVQPISPRWVEGELQLWVWGEQVVKLRRRTRTRASGGGYLSGIDGSVSWDYVSPPGEPPRVVLVAARGIEIEPPEDWETFPWSLDIYRVQHESLVPPFGSSIDTTAFMTGSQLAAQEDELLTPEQSTRRVLARNKPDGLHLEFPADPREGRFRLDLTVDPNSGTDGYAVDVHYYGYGATNLATGVHLCIWATSGVTIGTDGSKRFDTNSPGAMVVLAWQVSAELWQVPSLEHLPHPYAEILPLTPRLAANEIVISPNVPRFADDRPPKYTYDGHTITLAPKDFELKGYEDSLVYDFIDVVVGFIPFVGDLVDLTELVLVLTTGRDKWGRPVSKGQFAFMAFCAAVPFVSTAFARGAGKVVQGPELFIDFQGTDLVALLRSFGITGLADPDLARAAAADTKVWRYSQRFSSRAQRRATDAMIDFVMRNQDRIEEWTSRLCAETNELWLHVDDIYDGRNFTVAVLDDAFQRWRSRHPTGTPEAFLQSRDLRGTARLLAQALLGSDAVGRNAPRLIARYDRFPSHFGWFPFEGECEHVLNIDRIPAVRAELKKAFESFISTAMKVTSRVSVVKNGVLEPVSALADARPVIDAMATRLMQEVELNGAEKILGDALIAGDQIPLRERSARAASALFAACAEMRGRGLAVETLLDERMWPEVLRFVRGYVTRNGYEHGSRFELAVAGMFIEYLGDASRRPSFLELTTQLMLPRMSGVGSKTLGPDVVVFLKLAERIRATPVQLKSYTNLHDLITGTLLMSMDGENVLFLSGPEFLRQGVSDGARSSHLADNLIDGTGSVAGRVELSNVHVFLFDDKYLRETFYRFAVEAAVREKVTFVRAEHIASDLAGNPRINVAELQDIFRKMFPSGLDMNQDTAVIAELFEGNSWLTTWAQQVEQQLNQQVIDNLELVAGRRMRFVVRPASANPTEIIDAVATHQAAVDALGPL